MNRASGILLHPTSLAGPFGIGDLGPSACAFCDALVEAGQTYWQILPLGPTGYGDSPYQCFSAFAGNTLLISPEKLVEDGLVDDPALHERPDFPMDEVDYGGVYQWKGVLLRTAFERFDLGNAESLRDDFEAFVRENGWWLNDYAFYRAIKSSQDQRAWYEWPEDLRRRDDEALRDSAQQLSKEIQAELFYQFLFFRQWFALKGYANKRGLKIIGDIPIFVSRDSSDVWRHQDQFRLNPDGSPTVVAGVPPDFFSNTGQLWGNPIYDWDAMRADGFGWWVSRVKWTLQNVHIIRADHFRGFIGAWEVPGGDATAENGKWGEVPGRELFATLQSQLGELPIIAEDLGDITPEVDALRDEFHFPGMRILQFAFGGDAGNAFLPHNYVENTVAYTGTHDNDTSLGWFNSAPQNVREHCVKYLGSEGNGIHWALIRAAWASVAHTAIVPMQDLLGIGSEGRMNLPASSGGNWKWRLSGDVDPAILARLNELTQVYGRAR